MAARPHASLAPAVTPAWVGLAAGLLIVAGLGALDVSWGSRQVISATVVIGPFLTALLAPPRQTAVVALAAVAVAVASGSWNDNFGDAAYWLRLAVVVAGGGFAIVGAQARARVQESRRRFALLAALSAIGDGTETLEQTTGLLTGLLVPAFADLVVVDFVGAGEPRRLGVRASGRDAAEIEARLLQQPVSDVAVEATSLEGGSAITARLRARGRTLGAMSLSVTEESGRRYRPQDAEFADVLSERAALALDNAGLFAELETMEAQLSAALGSLTDAVTVQTRQGRLLYANDAAARSMGFASARELLATPPADIVDRYETYREDGTSLDVADLPGRRVLAGEAPEPLVLRSVQRETGHERWTVVKATSVRDRRGSPLLAVNVIEDITEAKRAELAQRLLAGAGELLASSLDFERTLQQVAELAVPDLADWCGVSLPDGHGLVRQVAVAHVDPDKIAFARELSDRYPTRMDEPAGAAQVLRDGRSQCLNDIPDELLRQSAKDDEHYELIARLGMRAAMVVPLMVGGTAIGTLTLVSAESRRVFTDADVQVAEELARRAGAAVENARLYTERSTIAATLQAGLLPQPLPEMPGWGTATLYRAAGAENWVGGDFYDAYRVKGGWMVVVGDVVGRGAPAAALTALTRHTIRAVAQLLDAPLDAVDRLNAELYARGGGALCTIACAVLQEDDAGRGRATILCAGHPQPVLLRGGAAEPVGEFGPIAGALAAPSWRPVTVPLAPGDTLVLYTDGVIDTVGDAERFGEDRLRAVLRGADGPGDAVGRIERALLAFERGEQADDTAALAVMRVGSPESPVSEGAVDRIGAAS